MTGTVARGMRALADVVPAWAAVLAGWIAAASVGVAFEDAWLLGLVAIGLCWMPMWGRLGAAPPSLRIAFSAILLLTVIGVATLPAFDDRIWRVLFEVSATVPAAYWCIDRVYWLSRAPLNA